jgi:hypothetical protein
MITIDLMGGLGNQLFQIFVTIAYALNHKHKFVFTYDEILGVGMQRPTYWNHFLKRLLMFTTANKTHGLDNDFAKSWQRYKEPYFRYHEIPTIDTNHNFALHGYFQSYKYFETVQDKIYKMIQLKEQQTSIYEEYTSLLEKTNMQENIISMHFRLGDYKSKQHYHPIVHPHYYEMAVKQIIDKEANHNYRVLYFCEAEDNIYVEQVIANLQSVLIDYPITFVKVDDSIADWKQMLMMSCCDHNIIANSSYSWWGAYLNTNTEKIVCYPNVWFGPGIPHTGNNAVDDMFPHSWTKIIV